MFTNEIHTVQNQLMKKADPNTKKWWEGYVKCSAPFLGVKMADIRTIVHKWHREQISENFDLEQQTDLALVLFQGSYTEEKLAGILFLQEILLPLDAVSCESDLLRLENLFENGLIYDWNICDWFSIKVLATLIKSYAAPCAEKISSWHKANDLWQSRSALVAFVPVAEKSEYYPLIQNSCLYIIKRDERFAKTAVGWILRDISKYDQPLVQEIIMQRIQHFSTESLNNATKHFSPEEKSFFRNLLHNTRV